MLIRTLLIVLTSLAPLAVFSAIGHSSEAQTVQHQLPRDDGNAFCKKRKLEDRLRHCLKKPSANEPSPVSPSDRKAVIAFALGLSGIGALFMAPTWPFILALPLLLTAFFLGLSANRKTERRGFSVTAIVMGSFVWLGMLMILLAALSGD